MKNNDIYLLAQYVATPKNPKLTSQKGYMNNPDNIQYNEQVGIVRGLKSKDLINQHVILNLTKEEIVKNQYKTGATFEEAFKYFYDGYSEYINESINMLNKSIGINNDATV